jgi:subtilisin-like proprotein convertase family protein
MTHRKLLYSALALVMAAAMLLSPAPPTAQAAPAGQDAPRAPDVTLNIDNTLAGPIPDGTAATGTGCSNWPFTRYFLVTQHISITDLNLGVNLDHVNRGQIRGKLTAPDGTSYEVIATSADTNNNYDILLDGDSGGALDNNADDNTASPYYTRTVLQTALNNFDGKDAFGGWQLFLCDNTLNGGTDNDGSFNRAQLQITGDVIAFTPPTHQQGPPIVETYYMPWPEDQLWTAMGLIFGPGRAVPGDDTCTDFGGYDANPRQPMINYSSITVSYANTVVTYDQWEDGYEAVITFPTQSTTEVWGDGNLLNGTAPGDADDLLVVGQVLILNDVMDSSTLQSVIDYDARDKIAASTPIAVSRALWSDGSKTLFAHVDEVYPTSFWGTDYRLPVGENADLNEMFQYTGVSVMAAVDGTVVSIDKDANGTAEQTCNLNQGQSCQWTDTYVGGAIGSGLNRNSRITSNSGHPIQVSLLTADYCAGFETRSFPLLPVDKWSNSYYNPVGTLTANGGPGADEAPTYVHLYNPNASTLTVSYAFSTGAVNTVSVPANSGANVTMTNLEGDHFYTTSGANFFAVATVDS